MFNGLYFTLLYFFGTNLLTQGLVQIAVFLPISVFHRKGISNGIQTEWNLRAYRFWNKHNLGDLEWTSRKQRGGHEVGRRAQGGRHAPHPYGPLVAPPTYFFLLYIHPYPETIRTDHKNLILPTQPSVSVRSHLGAFAGAPPEGESTMEGLYIISKASLMSCD